MSSAIRPLFLLPWTRRLRRAQRAVPGRLERWMTLAVVRNRLRLEDSTAYLLGIIFLGTFNF